MNNKDELNENALFDETLDKVSGGSVNTNINLTLVCPKCGHEESRDYYYHNTCCPACGALVLDNDHS